MQLLLSNDDLAGLSAATRNEIFSKLKLGGAGASASTSGPVYEAPEVGPEYEGIDLEGVTDLTFREIQTWMEAASEKTKLGLRVIAEQGPVIKAHALTDAGIENLPHFQSRTTIRTRTVTGDKEAFLLGWDDWQEVDEGEGKYAVTPITYQSLRRYFQLDQ
jgi:hypothetical protein